MYFKTVREKALKKWFAETKRQRSNDADDFNESFECDWQNRFGKASDDEHYSIFCSIGDWNTNLTDYLTDERYDHYD